jgi:hypothetical protein
MIHNHWLSITRHNSRLFLLCQWLWVMVSYPVPGVWIMVCYTEPVVVNQAVLYWSEWLWVMVCNAETVVMNHGVLFWASGCESCCAMISPVVVNRDVLCCEKGLGIMVYYAEPHRITHHDSQPLAQQNQPWFTVTGSAIHIMNNNHWLSITHHDSQPLAQYNTP